MSICPLPVERVSVERLPDPYRKLFECLAVEPYAIIGFTDCAQDLNDPFGNIKRIAARGIIAAKKKRDGFESVTHVVDSTSGNYGPALASALAEDPELRHIKVACVVAKTLPKGKLARLEAAGVNLVLADDSIAAMEMARALGKQPGWWYSSQYANPDNAEGFVPYGRALASTLGGLGVFAAGVGSGGTIIGLTKGLRQSLDTSDWSLLTIAGTVAEKQSIPGMRGGAALKQVKNPWRRAADKVIEVDSATALAGSKALQAAGICGGPSSGAALHALYAGLRQQGVTQLNRLRNQEGNLVAAFVCADRWEIYAEMY